MTKILLSTLLTLIILFFNCSNNGSKINPIATSEEKSLKQTDNSKSFFSISSSKKDAKIPAIPNWYLRNRVQVLTLLLARDIGQSYFLGFPKTLANAGAPVITRDIKSGDEQPWWPSKYGTILPKAKNYDVNGRNLAKDIIDGIHALNMKAIIYYRHQEDSEMLSKHPDWACLDVNGNIIKSKRGIFLSLNSPYKDVLIQRLKELAFYGADGLLFDEIHIPIKGDFSKYSQDLYKAQFGSNLTADYKAGKIKRFFDFRNNSIQKFFDDLRDTLEAAKLNPLIIVSGNSWPAFSDLHMTSDFYKNYTLKSEVEVPNRVIKNRTFTMPATIKQSIPSFYNNAFDFSFMRDNTYGPPYIWAPQITTQKDAEAITAGLISLGCISELGINSTRKGTDINNFKTVLQWDKLYGDYFEKMSPYATVGIVVSEKQRNEFIGNAEKAWNQAMLPVMLAFKKLYQNGVPVRLISDAQLKNKNSKQLVSIYANKSLPLPASADLNTYIDLKDLPKTDGLALAQKLGSPIFCKKDNEYSHVNYFIDTDGYLYIVTALDFNSVKKKFTEKQIANLSYKKGTNYNTPSIVHLYVKTQSNASGTLQDIVNNTTLKSSNTENGYSVFELKPNEASLGLYRFKFNR